MRLVEIRDLDGPNLFLLEPAMKIEFDIGDDAELDRSVDAVERAAGRSDEPQVGDDRIARLVAAATSLIADLHRRHGQPAPRIVSRRMEKAGHLSVAFGWTNRAFGLAVAGHLVAVLTGVENDSQPDFESALSSNDPDNRPLMIRDAERRIPVVGVTGTNGKTTTTRLLAHILMQAGKHVGWSSTSGVYIDGVEVLQGDYSGPSGARRAINDPLVEVAVVETARGGILLRGLACESNDVSVFTNVSGDHLNLHGVHTVQGLAEVKAIVVRTTKAGGTAVLNADDPLVVASTGDVKAERLFFTCEPFNAVVDSHLTAGGRALALEANAIVLRSGDATLEIAPLSDVPMTFDGRATHMVANAMAAAGAGIGLGLPVEQIARGLATFRSTAEQNPGRLNVFDKDGVTVVLDFAHNEHGLTVLLDFARKLSNGGRIAVMIGTAGDRTEESLREIGRLAAEGADRVIVKRTEKYERGRSNEEMISLYREGAAQVGRSAIEVAPDEVEGLRMALADARSGDVIALMCQEHVPEVVEELRQIATPLN